MMKEVKVLVVDPVGLHARPATTVVSAANKFNTGDVVLTYKGREVDMKSIMGVMSLAIPTQSEITISCNGEGEEEALKTIITILRTQKIIDDITVAK